MRRCSEYNQLIAYGYVRQEPGCEKKNYMLTMTGRVIYTNKRQQVKETTQGVE